MNQAHAELAAMDAEELRLLDARNAQVHRDRRVLLYAIALAIAVSLAVGAGGIAAIRRYVRSLEQANSALGAEIAIREATETQLRQAQKMDALGQLTGGVAHDFNNMLAIIVGSLDLMLRRLGREGDPKLRELAGGALEGAKRAGALTKRLLAFSRQLPLELRAIDVNRIVAELSVVFERTIGAPIEIHTLLAGGLWPAFADQPQLESAILNLVVNARDAIGGSSGKITLETANARLDEAYAAAHPGVEAGEYVMLAVTDTGSGMSPDVLARAFDPFFSTKPKGAGTGLGLSQVHGFIRQSGGHVNISSELGQGTTVKLYLPRHTGPATGEIAQAPPRSDVSRAHTVLVAEDESDMRAFTAEALKELGCSVVEAENTQDALEKLDANPDVDLLLTDIMMPGEDGRELANAAQRRKPDLKVIYITGYTPSAMVDDQAFDRDTHLLSKPFTLAQLELKIRNVFGA